MEDKRLFQCLDEAQAPKRALGASVGLHAALLIVLVLTPLVAPQVLKVEQSVVLIAPPPERVPPPPEPVRLNLPREVIIPKAALPEPVLSVAPPPPPPKPVTPAPEIRVAEVVTLPPPPPAPAPAVPVIVEPKPSPAPPPKPPVVTNVFSTPPPPNATAAPARNVETAGFGEAKNAAKTTKPDTVVNAGFGETNAAAAKSGATTAVAAAGFGDSAAGVSGGKTSRVQGNATASAGFESAAPGRGLAAREPATVASAGFGQVAPAAKTAAPKPAEVVRNDKPVEILTKPRPDYTDEARKMRIEGEVSLRVLFTASGEARVLEVVRGLGYGLNENAIRAAQGIRFKPAQREGQPVDSTAVVHIAFQLAF